jgi:hypothetical protein
MNKIEQIYQCMLASSDADCAIEEHQSREKAVDVLLISSISLAQHSNQQIVNNELIL